MVIVAPFYQQTVRHVAKQGVSTLIDNFVPVAARDVAHKVEDFSGEKNRSLWCTSAQKSSSLK